MSSEPPMRREGLRTAAFTAAALAGFAANSLLCRMALRPRLVDAATFTSIRIVSGALALVLIGTVSSRDRAGASLLKAGSVGSAAALFAYAAAFSFAYLRIGAGVGALLLFGAVQATMLAGAVRAGERLGTAEWVGLLAALGGLVAMMLPGLSAPDPAGAALMILAGVAWGIYSLRGRGAVRPLAATASNFVRAVPFTLALSLAAPGPSHLGERGALLAAASGAITSGVGYSLWYAALRGLTSAQAAVLQLAVPVLAAAGAVALLGESLTPRLAWCGTVILGGVALAILGRGKK
jgi:drug/metabolite transporter (DMT)-like permease